MRKQIRDENNRMTKAHRFVFITGSSLLREYQIWLIAILGSPYKTVQGK